MNFLQQVINKIKAKSYCLTHDHDWDKTHGYMDAPVKGAACQRPHCGKVLPQ